MFREASIADVAAVAASESMNIQDLASTELWIQGTFVGTTQPQVSVDDIEWFDQGSALTAPARVAIPDGTKYVRHDVTAHTSGSIKAIVSGQRGRTII